MAEMIDDDLTLAARITVVFLMLYSVSFVNILICKKRGLRMQKTKDKPFNRYSDPSMLAADRLLANMQEWCPVFLGLLWSLAATANLSSSAAAAAWTYVALRALYVVLVLRYGVSSDGMQNHLWCSTFPAYFCLLSMLSVAVRALYF